MELDGMSIEAEVGHVMRQMLTDIVEGTVKSDDGMDDSGTTNNISSQTTPDTKNGLADSKPRPHQDPIVIELDDDDDEMEYSKENIQKAPVKSLVGLVKNLSAEATAEIHAKIKIAVSKLPRETLEELYCKKLAEFVELNRHIRNLEIKSTHFGLYKDKVIQKTMTLQKQVADLSKSMRGVTENIARNPKYAQQAFTPIKFFRAVGVQVRTEPLPRLKTPLANSKVMNTPPPPLAIAAAKSDGNLPNGIISQGQGVKRLSKPTISVDDVRNQVQPDPPPAKVARRPGPLSARLGQHKSPATSSTPLVSASTSSTTDKVVSNGTFSKPGPACSKGLVELAAQNQGNGKRVIVTQKNGLSYIMNTIPQGVVGGLQLLQTQGQTPVLIQQTPTRSNNSGQIVARQPAPRQVVRSGSAVRGATPIGTRPAISIPPQRQLTPTSRISSSSLSSGPFRATNVSSATTSSPGYSIVLTKFVLPELPPPSPLPKKPKEPPPRPTLTLTEQGGGIVLSWTHIMNSTFAEVQSYQIFACQEPIAAGATAKTQTVPQWKRVGDVKALPLPMACTLSQFTDENRYHFIVRAVDVYNRTGPFCDVVNILLKKRVK